MGDETACAMCHDIEDPTFDATATATSQLRPGCGPIHRPPRSPQPGETRTAHWTVEINEESYPRGDAIPATGRHRADPVPPRVELDPIDPSDEGAADYSGPLRQRRRLRRVLALGAGPDRRRGVPADAPAEPLLRAVGRKAARHRRRAGRDDLHQAADRPRRRGRRAYSPCAGLPGGVEGAVELLEFHPLLNPVAYVDAEFGPDVVHVRRSPAHEDGAWVSLVGPDEVRPLQAIVRAVDAHLDVEVGGSDEDWTARIIETDTAAKEFGEVAVVKVSGGSTWVFKNQSSLFR